MPQSTYSPDVSAGQILVTPKYRECSTETRDEQIAGWQLLKQSKDPMGAGS